MDAIFSAKMINNEVEIILNELKLKHVSEIEKTKNGASIIIAFTDKNFCNKAFESLKVCYNHKTIFGTFKIDTVKKTDYIVRINFY